MKTLTLLLLFGTAASADEAAERLAKAWIRRETKAQMEAPVAPGAMRAVQAVREAAEQLEVNNSAPAHAALLRALSDLEPLALKGRAVPVAFVQVHVVESRPGEARRKRIAASARRLTEAGRYQAARVLLRELASEISVTTVSVPLASFSGGLQRAVALLDRGKPDAAYAQVIGALHGLKVAETAIPLPVLRAQAFVAEANELARPEKFAPLAAAGLLEEAEKELERAERLGYGTRDYQQLYASIRAARDSLAGGGAPRATLFGLSDRLQALRRSVTQIAVAEE